MVARAPGGLHGHLLPPLGRRLLLEGAIVSIAIVSIAIVSRAIVSRAACSSREPVSVARCRSSATWLRVRASARARAGARAGARVRAKVQVGVRVRFR